MNHPSTIIALRHRASAWIHDLYADFTLHGCLPQCPLFPYSDLDTELSWFDEDTSVLHLYAADFRFRRPDDPSSPILWSIASNVGTIGRVELDPHLFYNQDEPVQVTGDLILLCMFVSVTLGERIYISSRVLCGSSGTFGLAADSNMEVIEMRTRDRAFVEQLGSRVIPKRACVICHGWIPAMGANVCLDHLNP